MDSFTQILIPVLTALGGGGTILALIKAGYLKIQIGTNGNGTKTEIGELHRHAEIANEEMGEINRKFDRLLNYAEKESDQHNEMLFILRDLKEKK